MRAMPPCCHTAFAATFDSISASTRSSRTSGRLTAAARSLIGRSARVEASAETADAISVPRPLPRHSRRPPPPCPRCPRPRRRNRWPRRHASPARAARPAPTRRRARETATLAPVDRRAIAAARAHVDARPLHRHLDRAVGAIELRIGGVVANQVIRTEIAADAGQRAGQIVGVLHGEAVGALGELAQAHQLVAQVRLIDRHRRRRRRPDRRVERGEAARIDGVEAGVRAIRDVGQIAELLRRSPSRRSACGCRHTRRGSRPFVFAGSDVPGRAARPDDDARARSARRPPALPATSTADPRGTSASLRSP